MGEAVQSGPAPVPGGRAATWLGQPRGLYILFLTETWERFSFYGMRSLLIYYMVTQIGFAQAKASLVYGVYTAFIYFTPVLGGIISDRWLGRRRSVVLGACIMIVGHILMAFETALFPALAIITLGNGLFLPSLPSQIVDLYDADDPRRASAYNVYYAGINLGAFLAPFICGTLGEWLGWHWGFGAAAVGLSVGLAIYTLGRPYLPPDRPAGHAGDAAGEGASLGRAMVALAGVIAAVVVLRSAYEQMGNTVAIWLDGGLDRALGAGFLIPRTWFQALNPLLVFILTPLLVWRWTRLARKGREASPMRKMAAGATMVAAAYLFLAALTAVFAAWNATPAWPWAVVFFVLITAGELYIYPVGLALFGRVAPKRHLATFIAAWWLSFFAGNLLAGVLGTQLSGREPAAFFSIVGAVALTAGGLFLLMDRPVRRMEAQAPAAGLSEVSR